MKLKFNTVVIPLIGINIAAFIMQMFSRTFTEMFMLVSADVFSRPWILITSMFLHGGFNHLLFNMYALLLFGTLIEQRIGKKRFLWVYFISGILASFISTFFYERALGASGAIMGILGVTIMLMPHLKVLLFFVIPMSLRTAGIIFAMIDIFGVFHSSGVANIAHLVGLACGLAFGYYLLKQKGDFSRRFTEHRSSRTGISLSDDDIADYFKYGRL